MAKTSTSKLKIGIIGCGEVAQIMHIPALLQLADDFEITALCDASASVLGRLVQTLPGEVKYTTDVEAFLAFDDIDAVLVANPHYFHASHAIKVMQSGRDVLIEKPVCLGLEELALLQEAEQTTGRIAQVGYMRRYAPIFSAAKELVAMAESPITYVRVADYNGSNALTVDATSRVLRPDDLSTGIRTELRKKERAKIAQIIGTEDPALVSTYAILLGLNSHDFSAMRGLLGAPKKVTHATQRGGGLFISACFDYGGFFCDFISVIDEIPRADGRIEIHQKDRVIRCINETPYVRHLPGRLEVETPENGSGHYVKTGYPQRIDPFVTEWQAFASNVRNRKIPQTNLEDAKADFVLAADIVKSIV